MSDTRRTQAPRGPIALELRSTGPRGNQTVAELRADYELLTTGERLAQASQLSRTVTGIAAGRKP